MTLKMIGVASAAILLAANVAQAAPKKTATPAAPAQAAPPQQPAQPWVGGPALPGVCVFNAGLALQSSLAGKSIGQRMQQLTAQAGAEIQAEGQALKTDEQAFVAKRSTLTQEQQQQQAAPLQQREEALGRKEQRRRQELEATRDKALQRFDVAITPIVKSLYQSRSCSILLRGGDAVMTSNPQMDFTDQAVQQLNAQLPSMTFDREVLPQQ